MAEVGEVKVGVLLAQGPVDLGEWLADAAAFDAAGADALCVDSVLDLDVVALTAALAVVTYRASLVVALPDAGARTLDTIGRLSNGRFAQGLNERWLSVPAPDGRAAWRAVCADAAECGFSGVVVPADPRLLDILRNPQDPDDRRDLQLAQG